MSFSPRTLYYIVFIQALIGVLVSLYYSEILHLPPCNLCWYQRIFLYPIVPLTIVGILRKSKDLPLFILPLSTIGGIIAFYHTLLQYDLVRETLLPCQLGISCATKQIAYFGFITIPLMSLLAFILITACMWLAWWYNQKTHGTRK